MRELLAATLDWAGGDSAPRHLLVSGTSFRLTHLADGAAGAAALLCEAPPGVSIPEYRLRRLMRDLTGAPAGRQLVIFTDAAHSTLVWTWVTHGDVAARVYRELSFRPGQAWGPLRPVLESIAAGPPGGSPPPDRPGLPTTEPKSGSSTAPGDPPPAGAVEHEPLLSALSRALGESDGRGVADARQEVQILIEESVDTETIRGYWDLLLSVRAFDPRCGSGEWLEAAHRTLAAAYDAVLERMRSAVDDMDRRQPRPRVERLGDFRRLVQRAGGWRDAAARIRFTLELPLLHNLFGIGRRPDVYACRERLVKRLAPPGEPALLSTNVREAPPPPAAATPAATERAEMAERGRAVILDLHMATEIDQAELGRAMTAASRASGREPWPGGRDGRLIERPR